MVILGCLGIVIGVYEIVAIQLLFEIAKKEKELYYEI